MQGSGMDELFLSNDEGKARASVAQSARAPPGFSRRSQVLLCLILHFVLIIVHVLFLAVWSHHHEHNLVFGISNFSLNWLPVIVTAVSQLFGAVRSK